MEIKNKKLTQEAFENIRQQVMVQWPTGAGVDREEALRYQENIAPKKRFAQAMDAANTDISAELEQGLQQLSVKETGND